MVFSRFFIFFSFFVKNRDVIAAVNIYQPFLYRLFCGVATKTSQTAETVLSVVFPLLK